MRLEDLRIEVARLTRQELSVLSDVSISTIQRAEEGKPIRRLMMAKILAGLSRQLGRTVSRDEIDEFKGGVGSSSANGPLNLQSE